MKTVLSATTIDTGKSAYRQSVSTSEKGVFGTDHSGQVLDERSGLFLPTEDSSRPLDHENKERPSFDSHLKK
jgi:hypothetical protein